MIPTIWLMLGCVPLVILMVWHFNKIRCDKCRGRMRLYVRDIHQDIEKCEWHYHCEKCHHSVVRRGQ